jgi:hypothetical protein
MKYVKKRLKEIDTDHPLAVPIVIPKNFSLDPVAVCPRTSSALDVGPNSTSIYRFLQRGSNYSDLEDHTMTKHELILVTLSDTMKRFFGDDRSDDDELPVGAPQK